MILMIYYALDHTSADYIMTRAMATNKMPLQILGEVVHEKIAEGAVDTGILGNVQ